MIGGAGLVGERNDGKLDPDDNGFSDFETHAWRPKFRHGGGNIWPALMGDRHVVTYTRERFAGECLTEFHDPWCRWRYDPPTTVPDSVLFQ